MRQAQTAPHTVPGTKEATINGEKVKVFIAQSYLILCKLMDCNSPASSVQGILQAGILEWVAIPFSRGSSQLRNQTGVSHFAGRFFTV